MFDSDLFVREMVRRNETGEVRRALDELWIGNYNILQFQTVEDVPIILLEKNVIEVKAAYLNNVPLSRTREILLDAEDPSWRAALSDLPTSYIWRGEQNHIRLHPIPDDIYELWIIVQEIPTDNIPKWFNLVAGIRGGELLALSNNVAGRGKIVEYLMKLRSTFNA